MSNKIIDSLTCLCIIITFAIFVFLIFLISTTPSVPTKESLCEARGGEWVEIRSGSKCFSPGAFK